MKVLVIGGTGNIGREVVKALPRHGHEVIVLSRGSQATSDGIEHVVVDRQDRTAFAAALRDVSPEVIIDLAVFEPADAEALVAACGDGVRQLIYASTVNVYGPPVPLFCDEHAPLTGTTTYGSKKAVIDRFLLDQHAGAGLPVTVVRPCYVYGPGMTLRRQVHDERRWVDRLRRGLPMLSAGDGDRYFHFLASPDAAEFFALCVGRESLVGEAVNLVHPEPLSWDDWHRLAMQAVGVECEIVHAPKELLLAIDPKRYGTLRYNFGYTQLFSGAKAARLVPEWRPTTNHVEWMRANLDWMDEAGEVSDTRRDPDNLEDRLIAALKALPEQLAGELA